jgi:transcriptional regulator with XRE-family HTH domain
MTISEKLKQARTDSGLSQEEVADKLGVSRQTMSNWENGRSFPDIVSVMALSDIYNVALDSLMKGDTKMLKHMEESTNVTKSNKQVAASIIALILFLFGTAGTIVAFGGYFRDYIDLPTLVAIIIPLLAVLTVTRSFKLFGTGFKAALFPKRKVDETLRANAAKLYRLLSKTTAFAAAFGFLVTFMNTLQGINFQDEMAISSLALNTATAMMSIIYGLLMIIFFFEPIAFILRRTDTN